MSRDASASEKNLTVKDTSVKTIVSPCGGVKCEYGEASALQSTEVLHPVPLHSAAHEGCGPCEKSYCDINPIKTDVSHTFLTILHVYIVDHVSLFKLKFKE